MAVVTTKSTPITNRDATPRVLNNPQAYAGQLRGFVGVVAIANGDSTGSKYIVGSLPSNALVRELKIYSPDIGTTTVADVGLYKTTEDGGAVVDADFFGSAVSLKDGALNASDVTHEAAVFTIANAQKPLWEALGLSADPGIWYDVVLTLTGDADAAGSVKVSCEYAV